MRGQQPRQAASFSNDSAPNKFKNHSIFSEALDRYDGAWPDVLERSPVFGGHGLEMGHTLYVDYDCGHIRGYSDQTNAT